jgi:uncharacterized membrane protein
MTSKKTLTLVMAALMASMTCIATKIIQFPSPIGGYIHLGDGLVLLSGIILGPLYGGAAAGIGSMFADLLGGYTQYAIATLIIKALAAIVGGFIYSKFSSNKSVAIILAGIFGGIIVTTGYFFFDSLILGYGVTAAANIPGNILQNVFGIIVSSLLLPILSTSPYVKNFMAKKS